MRNKGCGGGGGGIFYLECLSSLSSNMEETVEDLILIQVKVPDINVEKTLQFSRCSLIWEAKQQILAALPKVDINIENSLFCLKRTGTQIWSNFDIFYVNFFLFDEISNFVICPLKPALHIFILTLFLTRAQFYLLDKFEFCTRILQ